MFSAQHVATMQNTAFLTGGWVLIVGGLLAAPIPGPFTTPALALGGIMLVPRSPRFRRMVAGLRGWFPEISLRLTRRSANWPRAVRYVVLRTDPRRFRTQPA